MLRRLVLITSFACACASRQALPPGNELEATAHSAEVSTVGDSKLPAESAELAKAFEPSVAPVAAKPAPRPEPVIPAQVDASAAEREAVAAQLKDAKQRLAAGKLDEATELLTAVEPDARKVGPTELQLALELEARVAVAGKDWRAARKFAEAWLEACGPDRVEGCRARAMAVLTRVAAQKTPEAAPAKARAQATRTADECLQRAEAAGRARAAAPPCLESALGTYRAQGDKLQLQRAQLARAQSAAGDPTKKDQAAAMLAHAASSCDEPRCVSARRRARKLEGWLLLEAGDVPGAARAMLEEMRLASTTLPVDRRRYARTAEVDKVCTAFDAKEGAGSCRKLEKHVVGDYLFKDFSAQKSGAGLPPATVRTVNEHYGVILQECLSAEAERLKPPAFETYQVRWMVRNDGHVEQVHLGKDYQEESPLAHCLREQFDLWRYPRYDGEAQHVEQSFTVSARERR